MKKIITKKTALSVVVLSLKVVICFSLLIGGTWALFSDTNDSNVLVTAGNLEMELMTVDLDGNETNISGNTVNIFGSAEWEPGQTKVVYFKVRSRSNIDVKYILHLVVADDNLEGAMEYCTFEGTYANIEGQSWESLTQSRSIRLLTEGQNPISGEDHVPMSPDEEHYYTMFIHMRDDASGYQNKTSKVDVYLYAMQGNTEDN